MDREVLTEYDKIDLTPLLGVGKFVVFCQTEYEAQCLLAAVKEQFPDKCRRWSLPDVRWEDTRNEGQLYFPDINNVENIEFCWNDMDYPDIDQYTVINCSDLFAAQSDLNESGESLDILFGGAV